MLGRRLFPLLGTNFGHRILVIPFDAVDQRTLFLRPKEGVPGAWVFGTVVGRWPRTDPEAVEAFGFLPTPPWNDGCELQLDGDALSVWLDRFLTDFDEALRAFRERAEPFSDETQMWLIPF
jgi:hypothetical protein